MIKKTLTIILGLMLTAGLSAQVQWHSIADASKAKIGTKMYFVDFYTSWCGYCKKMDRETFTDTTVAKILNRYFYPVKFNAEGSGKVEWFGRTYNPGAPGVRGAQHQFAAGLRGYPSFVIYASDGTRLTVMPGYYGPRDFAMMLWYIASGDNQKYPYERYRQIFDQQIRPTMEAQLNSKN